MFVHHQRLLLFVAAALAVAMNMNVITSAQAAAVPAAYRERSLAGGQQQKDSLVRRMWNGIPRNNKRSLRKRIQQQPLRANTANGSGSSSGSGSGSGSGSDDSGSGSSGSGSSGSFDSGSGSGSLDSDSGSGSGSGSGNGSGDIPTHVSSVDPLLDSSEDYSYEYDCSGSGEGSSSSSSSLPTVVPATSSSSSTTGATTTSTPSTTSTTASGTSSASVNAASPIATVTTAAGTQIVLQSNTNGYGYNEAVQDLNNIMQWAGDNGNLTPAQQQELIAALFSGSARYWPELPTQVIMRIMMADIRAESDFRPAVVGGSRLNSGESYGLLQISPYGNAQVLPLIQEHWNVATHNFTWGINAPVVRAGIRGPLIDWETGVQIDLPNLLAQDLFRPWINVHAAMWLQSNYARTSSQDPYWWTRLNDYSWGLKMAQTTTLTPQESQTYSSYLQGASLPLTPQTALGSWVAGAATNGNGSYKSAGDNVSANYFNAIMASVSFLYNGAGGAQWGPNWLNGWTVNAGLTDYIS